MQKKIVAILSANYPGNRYTGFEHAKGHLIIARKADRHTMFVPAKAAAPIINQLLDNSDSGDAADEVLSIALGDWQSELQSGRVISIGGERLACYA